MYSVGLEHFDPVGLDEPRNISQDWPQLEVEPAIRGSRFPNFVVLATYLDNRAQKPNNNEEIKERLAQPRARTLAIRIL